jgi:hypothetical protein
MSDLIPAALPWMSLLLASLGVSVSLMRLSSPVPSRARHRRTGAGAPVRPTPAARRPRAATAVETPLDGTANRSVRPYVLRGTGAV